MSRAALLILALASCAPRHDWPMFGRDPSRNAVSPEKNPPTDWSVAAGKEQGLLWKARLGSLCFSSPVVADGLVWVGTNNSVPRDPGERRDGGVLMCFRERDGAFLWQHFSPRSELGWDIGDGSHMPLRSTPLVEGDRLWFANNRWELICLDVGPLARGTGNPVERWKLDLIAELGTWPELAGDGMGIGLASSIGGSYRGKLYLSTGQGDGSRFEGRVNRDVPALVCVDMNSGEILAREEPDISWRTLTANWSSPVVAAVGDGRTLIVFAGGDGFLHAYDPEPAPGPGPSAPRILRQVWKTDCRAKEKKHGFSATPVVHAGRVYVGVGAELGGEDGRFSCVDLATGRMIWSSGEVGLTGSSAIVHDGRVLVPDAQGYIHCLDAESGRQLWRYDTFTTIVTSPLWADGKLYVGTSDGEMVIIDVGRLTETARRFQPPVEVTMEENRVVLTGAKEAVGVVKVAPDDRPVRVRAFRDGLYASPALAHGTLFVAGDRWLYALRDRDEPGADDEPTELKRGRAPDAVFVPTPADVVEKMLELAGVRHADTVVDLGSGDGRIVIAAAKKYGCRAVGVEIDRSLVEESRRAIEREGLGDRATIVYEDLLKADLRDSSVVTLYVGSRLNELLLPKLRAMKPGSRIVSHTFSIQGVKPEQTVKFKSAEDNREHRLHLFRIPLQEGK